MFPESVKKLIDQLSKLPDIGPRAATRLVFYLLNQKQPDLDELSESIKKVKTEIGLCQQCFNLVSKGENLCSICRDKKREVSAICVVETVLNIPTIEKTKQYNGLYHILGGLISPTDGIGPDNLRIKQLIERVKKSQPPVKEIIFALSPSTEGDTTSLYIERLLKPMGIKISRLGRGLSMGSDLEYIDENTLTNAFLGRR